MTKNDIINELRKAYDTMLADNTENLETEPLSDESRQRIREMVNRKMNNKASKNRKADIRLIASAAAAFAVLLVCGVIFSFEPVRASIAKLFGFAPSVGVVENADPDAPFFVTTNSDISSSNDMIEIEIKDAVVFNNTLEVRYVLNLTDITDKELETHLNNLDELYLSKGYGAYFKPLDHGFSVSPLSSLTFMGTSPELLDTSFRGSEDVMSARHLCISQTYNVEGLRLDSEPYGKLTVGDISVDFGMKKVILTDSEESIGAVSELDGIKVLCVPRRSGDTLSLDYYVLDCGEYAPNPSFRRWDFTDILFAGDTPIAGEADLGYIFDSDNSSHMGFRVNYDLSGIEEGTDIAVKTSGIFAEKFYDGRALTFDAAPEKSEKVNKIIDFDGAKLEIAEVSHGTFGEAEGCEEYENGYLVLTAAIDNSENEQFMELRNISINGIAVDGYYCTPYDLEYMNISIPLPVPYSELHSVEFASADMFLSGEMEFDLTDYVW